MSIYCFSFYIIFLKLRSQSFSEHFQVFVHLLLLLLISLHLIYQMEFAFLEQSTHTPQRKKSMSKMAFPSHPQNTSTSLLHFPPFKTASKKKEKYQSSQPHISRALKVATCHPTLAPSTIHNIFIPCRGILAVGYRSHSSSWKTGHRRRGLGCGQKPRVGKSCALL